MLRALRRPCITLLCWLATFVAVAGPPTTPDYEREKRWADQTLEGIFTGEEVWIAQPHGHRFLGLYIEVENAEGAVIVAHGRGWSPDFELYGELRTRIAEQGYSTLSIQMPVLDGTAKLGDYLPVFPDAAERIELATEWLTAKGYADVAIVSHSIGATMTNYYLIRTPKHQLKAWAFVSIINGLEDMFRIQIPVLDIYGSEDWDITKHGADERLKQIVRIEGSHQVKVQDAGHFFEGKETELVSEIVGFLDRVMKPR